MLCFVVIFSSIRMESGLLIVDSRMFCFVVIWIRAQWRASMSLYRPQESFQPRKSAMNLVNLRCSFALHKLNISLPFQLPRIHQLKPLRAYTSSGSPLFIFASEACLKSAFIRLGGRKPQYPPREIHSW
jgi:hypothetical protein